jgi:hypothetical protein
LRNVTVALLSLLVLTACSDKSQPQAGPTDAVLYTIGLSTDPYGESAPAGFGIATDLLGQIDKDEVRAQGLGGFVGAQWVESNLIVVPRPAPPIQRPALYRYDGGLEAAGAAPVPGAANFDWSPDRHLFAYEPVTRCRRGQPSTYACYRSSGKLFVVGRDGADRRKVRSGHLLGWTPDGRLAYFANYRLATPRAFDPATGSTGPVLPGWQGLPLPAWSADRRYVAAITEEGLVVARAEGRVVQRITSKLTISMLAWSSVGNRLAFTTSGSPDPHQLFVVDPPGRKPRLLYATGDMHFDWVTWSPDGRWLLLDEEHMKRWLLLRTDRSGERRSLPRLGGRPLWCCPVNSFQPS